MRARCGFVIVVSLLCLSNLKTDAVETVRSHGTCPSSFVQSKKLETKTQDTEKSDEEEQAGQDGEMGMMDTENKSQVKEAIQQRSGHKSPSFSQVSPLAESPDCSEFMTEVERSVGNQIGGQAVAEGADAACGMIGDVTRSAMKAGLGTAFAVGANALAGPFGAMIGGTFAEVFIPDPNNARITALEKGMICLHEKILVLEEDLRRVHHEQELQSRWISTLTQIPMKRKISNAKLLVTENEQCAKLMRCVKSGTELPEDCESRHWQLVKHCDATAFALKLSGRPDYNCFKEEYTNEFNQMVPIELAKQEKWVFAREFVVAYQALFLSMMLLWNSLEEWATALCTESCLEEDMRNIKFGFHAFKNVAKTQVDDERALSIKMNEAEKKGLNFGNSRRFAVRNITCQLSYEDDLDKTITYGWQWFGTGKPPGHDDVTKDTIGKWQARNWKLDCGNISSDRLQELCLEKPCTTAVSYDTLLESVGCEYETWPGNCAEDSTLGNDCGIGDREKIYKNSDQNWVYNIGHACPKNIRDACHPMSCDNFMYIEYYNELKPDLDVLADMAEKINTRTIKNPPYHKAVQHWAISGSWLSKKTKLRPSEEHWAVNTTAACLRDETKSDPWKSTKMGTTCCNGTHGIRQPECSEHVTWEEAQRSCEAKGLRLCRAVELMVEGMGESEGCMFDKSLIWSSDVCPYADDTLKPYHDLDLGIQCTENTRDLGGGLFGVERNCTLPKPALEPLWQSSGYPDTGCSQYGCGLQK